MIVSSHILSEIRMTADHIGIISHGRLGYEGAVTDDEDLEELFMRITVEEGSVRQDELF